MVDLYICPSHYSPHEVASTDEQPDAVSSLIFVLFLGDFSQHLFGPSLDALRSGFGADSMFCPSFPSFLFVTLELVLLSVLCQC